MLCPEQSVPIKDSLIEVKSLERPPREVKAVLIVTMMMLTDGDTIDKMRYNLTVCALRVLLL